ncbi:MAG: hypothetical protein LBH42_05495 [Treponema sp.]|jgi:hypothetical protein|nr:hypothetical protein [Treponema sp.]
MKKRHVFLSLLLWLCLIGLPAQNTRDGRAPFITDLRAEKRNNLIRLTWSDSMDARGPVFIFRSTRPFSGTIPPNIKPVALPYGSRTYIDDIDDIENLHYFIAASDTGGQRFDIIIPQTNTVSVNIGDMAVLEQTPQAIPDHLAGTGIYNLRARPDGESVIITFNSQTADKNAILYRSMHPINQPQDLLNAVIIQPGVSSPFVDYPIPGLNWYYAVVYEDEITGGSLGIYPGRNSTVTAVGTSGEAAAARGIRLTPLPSMTIHSAVPASDFLWSIPDKTPLSPGVQKTLDNMAIPGKEPPPQKKPRVFSIDLETPASGEESALIQIVQDSFLKRDWENARSDLIHYLGLPRSKEVEYRARFYLGQTWYFTGHYNEALMEFLSVRSLHPNEANIWITAVLTAMVE